MSDEPIEMIGSHEFTPETPRELADALGISRRYYKRQLSDPSFGYIVANFVCAESHSGQFSLAHGRRFPDGSLHLFMPDPGTAWRRVLVARKMRNKSGKPDQIFVAFSLEEIRLDVPTILHCRKHRARPADSQLILNVISEGTPMHRRVLRV